MHQNTTTHKNSISAAIFCQRTSIVLRNRSSFNASTLLLDYFSVLFSERYLHNVYDIISDHFSSDVLLYSSIVDHRVFVYTCVFFNRIASFEKLKNDNNKYQNTISPEDG